MQSENRIFDDISKFINGAAGTLAGAGREFESNARERAKEWIGGLEFVSREEFEAAKAMAAQAREQVVALEVRIAALEAAGSVDGTPKTPGAPSNKAGD